MARYAPRASVGMVPIPRAAGQVYRAWALAYDTLGRPFYRSVLISG